MGYYDVFSWFYDASTERHYVEQREAALAALELEPGLRVLDLPCGTGQSFPGLAERLLPGGTLVGADFSTGMLAKARRRASKAGLDHVACLQGDARTFGARELAEAGLPTRFDRLHMFLGLTAFPDWRVAFENLWSLLEPGGLCVAVDVHDPDPGFQGKMVNLTARADIRRPFWEPLEAVAEDYSREDLPSKPVHGGQMILARGRKPAVADGIR